MHSKENNAGKLKMSNSTTSVCSCKEMATLLKFNPGIDSKMK
jgi:hypothetical protein